MNFISDIIIVTILSAFLLIIVAVISYKLGKKENSKIIINRRGRIIENENEINTQKTGSQESKEKLKEEIKIETDNKPAESKHIQSNMASVKELYSKKSEEKLNNKEFSDVSEKEKLSEYKFLKYTSNGYKPAKGDKESRVVRWR
ncbi:MAG: hypothetical protein P8Z35_14245 [Ignavibacteriaceae bacterium]